MNTSESPVAGLARSGKPIGVGIIGLGAHGGWAGRSHLPALRAVPGYEVRALGASSRQSAERSGQQHGVSRVFGTAAGLVGCDEVDLVVVAVKVPHHLELVRTALNAGKSVLCEWPLGNGLAEAEDMARSAHARALPTAVGLQARSHPALAYVRHLVADGYVGEVLSTTVVGSGGAWGGTVGPGDHDVLDAANGTTLLTVPFGHALDGLASVLGSPGTAHPAAVPAYVGHGHQERTARADDRPGPGGGLGAAARRRGGRLPLPRRHVPGHQLPLGDQRHRGGPRPHRPDRAPAAQPLTLQGGRGTAAALEPLPVPGSYVRVPGLDPGADAPAYAVAHAYRQFLDDLRDGTSRVPDFAHGVARHRGIASVMTEA
ncbi:hypothetical protein SHKM778_24820 [Streptomyces sp. KM77-8]|uniref:Gfo/Idh/MocA family oxidoreductase n=1 Tax=Streptomyces haneummycinicus TaxID=3074435 RepID=A0AAT9HF38_9ACTN